MISASDILHVISEINQYSVLLLELKDADTFAILQTPHEKADYFKLRQSLGSRERRQLVQQISSAEIPESLVPLAVDQFLREIEGKKPRHIWLETVSPERKELAFLSISELKTFLRNSSHR
jgi:hypothetical protein